MDLLYGDSVIGESAGALLMAEADTYFQAQKVSLALGLMAPLTGEYRVLRQAGYIRLPQAFAPRSFYISFFVHNAEKPYETPLPARDWFITLTDYESF
jgi:hypothetical protein